MLDIGQQDEEMGYHAIEGAPLTRTSVRGLTVDADQVSGYPSDGLAANISKDTTAREVLGIGDFDKEFFKEKNINFVFGKVNQLDYMSSMCNFPTMEELYRATL